MTMHKALQPRDGIDRLYVSRKGEGSKLASIEDSVDASIQWLGDYIEKHERGLFTAITNDTDNTMADWMTINRKQKWEEKQLYGCFKRLINNISHKKTWTWLRKGNLKTETESLLIAAQNNAIRTNHIKARIDNRDETINHISECSKLAQKDIRQDTTGWARWSTGKWARNLNLTIRTNGICTTQHLS